VIIKLLPEEISKGWDFIRYGITSVPSPIADVSAKGLRTILQQLLLGTVQCWAVVEKNGVTNQEQLVGFTLTCVAEDYVSGNKFLNIYDTFFVVNPTEHMIEDTFKAITEFAKGNSCSMLTAYTKLPGVLGIAKKLGAETDCRFIIWRLK
jgi:hypothetical protein